MAGGYSRKAAKRRWFTPIQHDHLERIADRSIAKELVRNLICARLKIWTGYAITFGLAALAVIEWGEKMATEWSKLLHGLGIK